ncbi:fungal-specific transcription factor domain-containing protein [Phlebopus sp. FC_14]|nr:fungal-specific transcription factor domain-containing protein [Phlebopus sp. FC_14]
MAPHSDAWDVKRSQPASGPSIPPRLNVMSFPDDYEEADELSELPSSSTLGSTTQAAYAEKIIRRRSSKACDQCRKSKCKCERVRDSDACKSCIMLGTPCTFLGPSRKRGPPKGYIDAIEARLHQMEALIGIMLGVEAECAALGDCEKCGHERDNTESEENRQGSVEGVLAVLRKDTLAREILKRVDASPYGVRGRNSGGSKVRPHAHLLAQDGSSGGGIDIHSTHPSNEWQDRVASLFLASQSSLPHEPRRALVPSSSSNSISLDDPHPTQDPLIRLSHPLEGHHVRRQRRRVEGDIGTGYALENASGGGESGGYGSGHMVASTDSDSGEDDVVDAVGQLSLNEDEQVRYHGKASGLYLLGINAKAEARNEGGIWRFPKARVWPPLPPSSSHTPMSPSSPVNPLSAVSVGSKQSLNTSTSHLPLASSVSVDSHVESILPDQAMQEHLLELYFTYVHAAFPILHKDTFWEGYRSMQTTPADTPSAMSDHRQPGQADFLTSPVTSLGKRQHISPLLLLSMFAIAARYSPSASPPPSPCPSQSISRPPEQPMWTAGDNFLHFAKTLLDSSYASSLPSTVQALLLLGYRELGIGAMAQAWVYTGMAVRMAQDLGMHRAADGWARVGVGRLFGARALQERRRIWWGCVALDGYVSTYIGRPLAIFERDYDTHMPSVEESDEMEMWAPHPSLPPDTHDHKHRPGVAESIAPVPGRVLSCFTASATLSTILSKIVQSIYAIRYVSSRQAESIHLDGLLNKWYLDLPEHLRFESRYDSAVNPSSSGSGGSGGRGPLPPPPHVLTLHMQYWCTTLLLHRPFIRHIYKLKTETSDDAEARATSDKNYELCVGAANHIASIVSFYRESYCLQRAPVFLCFYVFTAGIMHVTSLSIYPNDPQARMGLGKCMDALQEMEVVWPSAARALELLRGCDPHQSTPSSSPGLYEHHLADTDRQERTKRAAEYAADSEDAYERAHTHTRFHSPLPPGESPTVTASHPYAHMWRATEYENSTSHPELEGSAVQQQSHEFTAHPIPDLQTVNHRNNPNVNTHPSPSPYSSYYSWSPSDGAEESYTSMPFPGTLSTSVLPQTYSTGLIEEKRFPHAILQIGGGGVGEFHRMNEQGHTNGSGQCYEQRVEANDGASGGNGGGPVAGKYPRFWSDYTSFPQMGMAYNAPHVHTSLSVNVDHPTQPAGVYLGGTGQYNGGGGVYDDHRVS